jgi:hypothetical protein
MVGHTGFITVAHHVADELGEAAKSDGADEP